MPAADVLTLLIASVAAFGLALLSAVAGFGGGVLLLPVFTALFGLRVAVPMLTLTQLASNGSRVWLNRRELRWRVIRWFAVGAVPFAVAGGLLLSHAPLAPLKRLLGVFLIGVVVWRRLRPSPRRPSDPAFAAVGAASGLGSALLGSVGPLTAPFFLAYGLTRAAYIGTEAASALVLHLTKIATYGAGDLLTRQVVLYGFALTPSTLLGAWTGETGRADQRSGLRRTGRDRPARRRRIVSHRLVSADNALDLTPECPITRCERTGARSGPSSPVRGEVG